jgi:hypothetical protein
MSESVLSIEPTCCSYFAHLLPCLCQVFCLVFLHLRWPVSASFVLFVLNAVRRISRPFIIRTNSFSGISQVNEIVTRIASPGILLIALTFEFEYVNPDGVCPQDQ